MDWTITGSKQTLVHTLLSIGTIYTTVSSSRIPGKKMMGVLCKGRLQNYNITARIQWLFRGFKDIGDIREYFYFYGSRKWENILIA